MYHEPKEKDYKRGRIWDRGVSEGLNSLKSEFNFIY